MGDRYSGRSPPPRAAPRGPPRDRDDNPNVEYFGAGESYRPGGHTGGGPYRPTRDRDNDRWNPPPRDRERDRDRDDRARREDIDSYIPPTSIRARPNRSRSPPPFRRRSRSPPPGRGRPELFPERAGGRSPPRRYSPPRDRPRSPPRRRSRSPFDSRGRTPEYRKPRDFSPDARPSPRRDSPPRNRFNDRPRSPPRRPLSPERNSYRPRSRSPPRRDDRPTYADERWRRRSPSPRSSAAASRRSSPPLHPDRASLAGSQGRSPVPRPRYDDRDRRDDGYTSRPRSPLPPRRNDYDDRDADRIRDVAMRDQDDFDGTSAPPTGPRAEGYNRPPPSGPARSFSQQASPPPSAPSVSAHSRTSTFAPPSGPRGSGPPRDFVSPPSALRGRTSLTYRAPGYRPSVHQPSSFDAPTSPVPPSGPRAASYSTRGDFPSPAGRGTFPAGPSRTPSGPSTTANNYNEYPFRPSNNSTSGTYPRSQRFDTTGRPLGAPTGPSSITTTFNGGPSHTASPSTATPSTPANFVKSQLNTLERIVPGGRHTPGSAHSTTGFSAEQERKMKLLEDDAERIRAEITEKQRAKREVLREWENRERESEVAALRSELAEGHLRSLQDEDNVMLGAAF